jgi:hypothetical protein
MDMSFPNITKLMKINDSGVFSTYRKPKCNVNLYFSFFNVIEFQKMQV